MSADTRGGLTPLRPITASLETVLAAIAQLDSCGTDAYCECTWKSNVFMPGWMSTSSSDAVLYLCHVG